MFRKGSKYVHNFYLTFIQNGIYNFRVTNPSYAL